MTVLYFFNLMKGVVYRQSKPQQCYQTKNNSYLSMLLSRSKRYSVNSNSLKKIDHFGKKQINLPTNNTSSQVSLEKKCFSPDRLLSRRQRNDFPIMQASNACLGNSTSHWHRTFRTQPFKKDINDEVTMELKENLVSTQCSQQSSHQKTSKADRIQQYQLVKMIGRGKFGQVFLAVHKKTGFIGALKVIEKEDIYKLEPQSQQKMKSQLLNEIKLQFFLRHPNLIQLYDFFYDQQRIYLFMELGTQNHIFDLLQKKGKLTEETTSVITRQLVKGVKYMHSQGVIHRDIKLQNIVFTCGMAKLCDFGWSVYLTKNFRSTICGTPLYLSPQILKGKKYNEKIDVWAIGTLACQLATGKNPFGIKRQEDLSKIVKNDIEMKIGSPHFKSFITFVLKKQPQNRPTAQVLLRHPFIQNYKDIQIADELFQLELL